MDPDLRQLNRTFLARQMLLERDGSDAIAATERLAGLQAQLPRPPFVALWTRLQCFTTDTFANLLRSGQLVRATMMRGTIHVMSRPDFIRFRRSIQPVLSAQANSVAGTSIGDRAAVIEAARACLSRRPQTFADCRAALAESFPDIDERAMGFLARMHIPLLMRPDNSQWAYSGSVFAEAESWLGAPLNASDSRPDLVLRYLAAFGPATVKDAQSWSGLQGLADVFEQLRPTLKVFRSGRTEYFDVPDGPDVPATAVPPPRFLAPFDNAILGHHDRRRIISDEDRKRISTRNLQIPGTFLIDGFVAGVWTDAGGKTRATLTLQPFRPIPRALR
ncbi:MAG TPA: winged helix DNA-binding domain-containing protein, partial [Bryobacteraceae bacterium]|nr:winged helix DNA-binding domain-containing protein [Bryobacteraceae bacterium]